MKKNKNGFTLIEILVTMTIVAILMGISLVSLQGARKVARDGKRKADLEQIRSALEIYRSDCHAYPANTGLLEGADCDISGTTEVYLEVVPEDPIPDSYNYYYSGVDNSYTLCAYLETGGTVVSCGGECGTGITCNYKVSNY